MLQSPRWLLMKDRHDEALKALKFLRGDGGEVSPETELELIRASLREEADQGSWADLLKGHNRRRTFIVVGIAFFFQATGNFFSGHFSALYVKSLGTINPLDVTVAQTALNTFTSFVGVVVVDRLGRRTLWLLGSCLLFVILMTTGGLGIPQPVTYSVSQGIVATMLLYQMTYSATIAPLYYTMMAEIPASRLRDKTVRIGATVNIVTMYVLHLHRFPLLY